MKGQQLHQAVCVDSLITAKDQRMPCTSAGNKRRTVWVYACRLDCGCDCCLDGSSLSLRSFSPPLCAFSSPAVNTIGPHWYLFIDATLVFVNWNCVCVHIEILADRFHAYILRWINAAFIEQAWKDDGRGKVINENSYLQ